jgi:glucose-1-phosphate adenylyltransferase
MPVGGSFRCIDFALSNMSNSHIQTVAVLTQYNSRSLNEHLSSSKWWDFGRKQGGLYLFTPTVTQENSNWYRGTADAIYQNIDFLKRRHEPYVIISSGDCVYKLDFNELLNYHVEKKADITIVCKDMPAQADVSRYGVVRMNEEARIVEFEEKPLVAQSNTISAGVYVLRRRQLIEMLEKAAEENRFDFVSDVLVRYRSVKRIFGYKLSSYWSNIATTEDYFRTNMDFLKPEVRNFFFREEPKIYSKVDDLPPAKYNVGSEVSNSLISSGCIINSKVENSVLFKQVFVGKNCVIKNSIILNGAYIGDNTHVENCIVESNGTLMPNTYYCGDDGIRIVNEKNERYTF